MDTRFWGPSGWQLFHLVAFKAKHPDDVLNQMKDVLPCKFCRASTTEFVQKHPLRGDPGKWLYDIHNMVNNKLRTQCAEDKTVVNPGPDPTFDEIKMRYDMMMPHNVPGRDFLFTIAANYPEVPEQEQMAVQRSFIHALAKAYPFEELRVIFADYLKSNEVKLSSRAEYMRWMYGLLKRMSKKTKSKIPTYKGYVQHVNHYRSGCSKGTYRGVTCRKMAGGGYAKQRDHKRTRRVSHRQLL